MKFAVICFALGGLAPIASGQLSTETLRSQYGSPLSRETFVVSPGLEIIVHYAISGHVCRLRLPASHNIVGESGPGIATTRMVDKALAEVVTPAMRSTETGRRIIFAGALSLSVVEYEHVTISEPQNGNSPALRGEITVTFKNETCRDAAIQQ